ARSGDFAICRDHISGEQIIAGKAVFARKPAVTSSKSDARNARIRRYSQRGCEPKCLCFAVEVSELQACFRPCDAACWINANALYSRKINQGSTLAYAFARVFVPSAQYRNR